MVKFSCPRGNPSCKTLHFRKRNETTHLNHLYIFYHLPLNYKSVSSQSSRKITKIRWYRVCQKLMRDLFEWSPQKRFFSHGFNGKQLHSVFIMNQFYSPQCSCTLLNHTWPQHPCSSFWCILPELLLFMQQRHKENGNFIQLLQKFLNMSFGFNQQGTSCSKCGGEPFPPNKSLSTG